MIALNFRVIMAQNVLRKLLINAETAEKRLVDLKIKVEEVRKIKIEEKIKELTSQNAELALKVEKAKNDLIKFEMMNGKKQYPIPGRNQVACSVSDTVTEKSETQEPVVKKEKKEKAKKVQEKPSEVPAKESPIDVRKLDFKIGKIVDINKHPDADSLYVEKIDCGEEQPRTVVSGLVNHVPIEEMRDRIVMVLCNLKPVKMRGVTSEAMVMCASSPEKVEVLTPPTGSVPGDVVTCEGYPREPEPVLNPKKKIFETCAPDLKTNNDKVACYKDSPLVVIGKGPIVAASLKDVFVK